MSELAKINRCSSRGTALDLRVKVHTNPDRPGSLGAFKSGDEFVVWHQSNKNNYQLLSLYTCECRGLFNRSPGWPSNQRI